MLVPERKSWFVRTDSLEAVFMLRQRNTICLANSFDLQRRILSGTFVTPQTDYIISTLICKENKWYAARCAAWYFCWRKSDIALPRSDIIFAFTLAKRISLAVRRISLRSNITRRKANITEKALAKARAFSSWGGKLFRVQTAFGLLQNEKTSDMPRDARRDIFADAKVILRCRAVILYSPLHSRSEYHSPWGEYHCVAISLAARRI